MPQPRALMWIDFESTGLLTDPATPTLLEGGWTITDPAGVQFTPLRHRFTALPAAETEHDLDIWECVHPDSRNHWWSQDAGRRISGYPGDAVRAMHADNGLAIEWAAAPADSILTEWPQLDELLRADLDDVTAQIGPLESGQILLAGGGVSHYEDRFMRYCALRTMGHPAMHYSTGADVSSVLRTISTRYLHAQPSGRVPDIGKADGALALARSETHAALLPAGWARIDVEAPGSDYATNRDVTDWLDADVDPHRAAPGIARALAAYRLLPYVLDQLTAGYADALDAERAVEA